MNKTKRTRRREYSVHPSFEVQWEVCDIFWKESLKSLSVSTSMRTGTPPGVQYNLTQVVKDWFVGGFWWNSKGNEWSYGNSTRQLDWLGPTPTFECLSPLLPGHLFYNNFQLETVGSFREVFPSPLSFDKVITYSWVDFTLRVGCVRGFSDVSVFLWSGKISQYVSTG